MTAGLVPLSPVVADAELTSFAGTFIQVASVAGSLARTSFVPESLRVYTGTAKDPIYDEQATAAQVAGALLAGQELGISPMASLRSIAIVRGTPALSALALRALVQSRGHGVWVREATNTRAVVDGLRSGDDVSKTQQITWTMDDARARGLSGRDNWRSQPRNMLIARATSEVCRLIAADAILGLAYTIEELDDGDPVAVEVEPDLPPAAIPPKRRTARRRTAPVAPISSASPVAPPVSVSSPPSPERSPESPQAAANGTSAPPEPAKLTSGQQRKIQIGFRGRGLNRAEKLAAISDMVDREVASTSDLSPDEATKVLDMLDRLARARPVEAPAAEPEPVTVVDLGPLPNQVEQLALGEDEPDADG